MSTRHPTLAEQLKAERNPRPRRKKKRAKLIVNGVVLVDQPVKIEKRGNVTRFDFT